MLQAQARVARPKQPLGRAGNEQVPLGIDFPLNGGSALFRRHPDAKLRPGPDPLVQQGTSRGLNEIFALTGYRLPS
jgi:hypothetical protein